MLKIIGTVTKEMYYKQNPKFISHTDLQLYEIPIQALISLDIGRLIYLNEETGGVSLETYKKKVLREQKTYLFEKEENKPIINDTTNLPN